MKHLLTFLFFVLCSNLNVSLASTAVNYPTINQSVVSTPEHPASKKSVLKKAITFVKALPEEAQKMDGLAVAGFICSLVGIFIAGIILGILGIIFSIIALNRLKTTGKRGKGLAIAGLVLGVVAIIGALIVLTMMQ